MLNNIFLTLLTQTIIDMIMDKNNKLNHFLSSN
jgi:hypothetical protein